MEMGGGVTADGVVGPESSSTAHLPEPVGPRPMTAPVIDIDVVGSTAEPVAHVGGTLRAADAVAEDLCGGPAAGAASEEAMT